MQRTRIIVAIAMCYFLFAVLLNSVGTVILQSINSFAIGKVEAASLEGFKDLSIALVSFLVASVLPRVGFKLVLLLALSAVMSVCLLIPSLGEFYAFKLLFAVVGCAFAVVKVSVYALIGQLSDSTSAHSALLNTIEGIFMVGVLSGYWIFSYFISEQTSVGDVGWLNVYYLLAALSGLCVLCVTLAPIKPEPQNHHAPFFKAFFDMLKLAYQPLVLIFVMSAFLYVVIEQGVGTWLPTFNNQILHLPVDISVQLTSIFAACLALGRLLAGQVLKVISWYVLLNMSLVCMAALILLTLPLTQNLIAMPVLSVFEAPAAAYLMPLIGLFMAPIYPLLNSVILSSLPTQQHAAMTGLIVVFSALGGTSGSLITGYMFDNFSGQHAFYSALIPIAMLFATVALFKKRTAHNTAPIQ
ncbi:MFS transporter [Pseudoalteromonas citrea]|nr:MFS transporter [Pseudoalteromonas citrea]